MTPETSTTSTAQRAFFNGPADHWNHPAYNMVFGFLIDGEIDLRRLRQAATLVVRRHRVLRATYSFDQDCLLMHVSEKPRDHFDTLPAGEEADRRARIFRLTRVASNLKLDLFGGSLVKFCVVGSDFLIVIHHSIADATSLEIIANEVIDTYNMSGAVPSESDEERAGFLRFCRDEHTPEGQYKHTEQACFWTQKIASLEPIHAPALEQEHYFDGSVSIMELTDAQHLAISRVATQYTPYTLTLFAVQKAVATVEHRTIGTVLIPISLRPTNCDQEIGLFTNLVPIATDFSKTLDLDEQIRGTQASVLEALQHPRCNVHEITASFSSRYPEGARSLTRVLLTGGHFNSQRRLLGSAWISPAPTIRKFATFDISIYATFQKERWDFLQQISASRVDIQYARKFNQAFREKLGAMIDLADDTIA